MHYARWNRHGDPFTTLTAAGGEGDSYVIAHQRLKRKRGRPDHCEFCGASDPTWRYQWAFDHRKATPKYDGTAYSGHLPYSLNVEDYVSLCVSCHKKFDLREGKA